MNTNQEISRKNSRLSEDFFRLKENEFKDLSENAGDLIHFKEDLLLGMREIEEKLNLNISSFKEEYFKKIQIFETKQTEFQVKLDDIGSTNSQNKVKLEKIDDLLMFQKKTTDQMITHEVKLTQIQKDLTAACYKYDKIYLDNLILPGTIGDFCRFKNMKEYIEHNIGQIASLNSFKEKHSIDLKSYKDKLELMIKQINMQLDNTDKNLKIYTNKMFQEAEANFKKDCADLNTRISEMRIENHKYAFQLQKSATDLNVEYDKILNIKSDIGKLHDNSVKEMKDSHKVTTDDFGVVRVEFDKIKNRFNEMAEFIKDVRFRKNLGVEVSKQELKKVSNKLQGNSNNIDRKKSVQFDRRGFGNNLILSGGNITDYNMNNNLNFLNNEINEENNNQEEEHEIESYVRKYILGEANAYISHHTHHNEEATGRSEKKSHTTKVNGSNPINLTADKTPLPQNAKESHSSLLLEKKNFGDGNPDYSQQDNLPDLEVQINNNHIYERDDSRVIQEVSEDNVTQSQHFHQNSINFNFNSADPKPTHKRSDAIKLDESPIMAIRSNIDQDTSNNNLAFLNSNNSQIQQQINIENLSLSQQINFNPLTNTNPQPTNMLRLNSVKTTPVNTKTVRKDDSKAELIKATLSKRGMSNKDLITSPTNQSNSSQINQSVNHINFNRGVFNADAGDSKETTMREEHNTMATPNIGPIPVDDINITAKPLRSISNSKHNKFKDKFANSSKKIPVVREEPIFERNMNRQRTVGPVISKTTGVFPNIIKHSQTMNPILQQNVNPHSAIKDFILNFRDYSESFNEFKKDFNKKILQTEKKIMEMEHYAKKKFEELAAQIKNYIPINFNPYVKKFDSQLSIVAGGNVIGGGNMLNNNQSNLSSNKLPLMGMNVENIIINDNCGGQNFSVNIMDPNIIKNAEYNNYNMFATGPVPTKKEAKTMSTTKIGKDAFASSNYNISANTSSNNFNKSYTNVNFKLINGNDLKNVAKDRQIM
jgi:hypothetical protein